MGLSNTVINIIRIAGAILDIGKMAVQAGILTKTSRRLNRSALEIYAALEEIARHRGIRYHGEAFGPRLRLSREQGFTFAQEKTLK